MRVQQEEVAFIPDIEQFSIKSGYLLKSVMPSGFCGGVRTLMNLKSTKC